MTYLCLRSLDESRAALRIKHSWEEQALAYCMSYEIKHHRVAKMEYCYSGTESLWYGSWNHHVCRKGKCAADRHSRSMGVNPSRKQRCCSPSCLWSQAQRDTFDPDNSQLKLLVIDWQYVIDVSVCVVELRCYFFFFPVESKNCMTSALYEYRNMLARRGAQFVPIGMPTICWKTFPPKTTKMLSTSNSSMLMMSSSVYLFFEYECYLTK